MSWDSALLLYGVILVGCMLGGVAIGASMGIVAIVGISLIAGTSLWSSLGIVIFSTTTSFTLVSVPLFVLMGEIIMRSGISGRFYAGLSRLLAPVPGSLAHANIVGCAIFSALCGSTVATALTMGTVALPEMRRHGYSDRLTIGTLTGGGCLGILIPPSIPMVVYAAMTNESVLALFMAGVIPGILLAALFLIYVAVRVWLQPHLAPGRPERVSMRDALSAFIGILPVTLLILIIFFSMYFGVVTPTEAAAFGCALALVIGAFYRQLSWKVLVDACRHTVTTVCILMFITINAQMLSFAVVQAGIGRGVATALADSGLAPFLFFLLLFGIYLVLGMFLDGLSLMLLTVPVLYPAMLAAGFDGVWTGVIIIVFIELGALTPPVGLNLFAIQSITRHTPLHEVAMSSLPYALIISGFCFLLYFFPELVTYLPQTLRG